MSKVIKKKSADFVKKKKIITKAYIKKLLTCNINDCALYPFDKTGNYINPNKGYLVNYLQLLNLLNNNQSYAYIMFPLLYGRDEKDIVDKISILNQCTQERIIFYIENYALLEEKQKLTINDIYDQGKTLDLVFLKHSNMDSFVKVYFLQECRKKSIKDFSITTKTIEEKLGYYYLSHSLMTYDKPKDEIISVQIFYKAYIYYIRDEILEKYNIDISDTNIIANYEKLYALLNKLGYVDKFYKKLYPKAKLLSSKVEKRITSHPKYIELLKYFNSYKPFEDKVLFDIQDIDIEKLIKTHIRPPFDVKWILEQYKIIKENHNYGIHM